VSAQSDPLTPDTRSPAPGVDPCEGCPLGPPRAVAARGPVPARLLLLSGAPRFHEEREGVAFASPAFPWLEETLAAAGFDPADIHYATLIGCRPPYQRPMREGEIGACAPRLDVAIRAVAPEVIVLCGPDATAALLPNVALTTEHGILVQRGRRHYYPIRHPYAALHSERYIEEVRADLRALAALLAAGLPLDSPAAVDAPAERVAAANTSDAAATFVTADMFAAATLTAPVSVAPAQLPGLAAPVAPLPDVDAGTGPMDVDAEDDADTLADAALTGAPVIPAGTDQGRPDTATPAEALHDAPGETAVDHGSEDGDGPTQLSFF